MAGTTKRLEGKGVILTGGSRGIGQAAVHKFAAEGANIVFTYLCSVEAARQTCRQVEDAGGRAIAVQSDVRERDKVGEVVDVAMENFGRIDVLVNNAHMSYDRKLFEYSTWEEFQREIDTLLKGPFNTIQATLPHMRKQNAGCIINVGSTMARDPLKEHSFYVAAKNALVGLTRALALELGPYGIQVNMLTPGPLLTEHNAGYSKEIMQMLGERTPLHTRLGTCEEVADAIVMLALPEARWVTGSNVQASGGLAIS